MTFAIDPSDQHSLCGLEELASSPREVSEPWSRSQHAVRTSQEESAAPNAADKVAQATVRLDVDCWGPRLA